MKKIKSQVRTPPRWKVAGKPPWKQRAVTEHSPSRQAPRVRPDRAMTPEERTRNEKTLRAARISTDPSLHPYWPGRQP